MSVGLLINIFSISCNNNWLYMYVSEQWQTSEMMKTITENLNQESQREMIGLSRIAC